MSELLILLGLGIVAFALAGGNRFYDFFWGLQYVVIRLDRVTMLWIGGILAGVGVLIRLTGSRPAKRSRSTSAGM
jgi:hypothetical protein